MIDRRVLLSGVALPACLAGAAASQRARAAEDAAPDARLIADLEQALSHAVLTGRFTVTGGDSEKLTAERYELGDVKHLGDGQWLIQARIRYAEHDVSLPLTLPVRWAGDTPIICVDEIAFPGLGTYTARVMIYRDHYAGFWTGKDHGGHLFGVIQRETDGNEVK
ncbi:MAG: hypothetical protein DCC67_03765 [Planctomycetota bacterium]|nr:MAG: hypothetical protein DCC67_03765 [Planctomycetota bacterium]